MSEIPTAEDFLKEKLNEESLFIIKKYFNNTLEKQMIEFAKLHVEAALKEASENAETEEAMGNPYDPDDRYYVVDKESILNSYPLENIK